MSNKFSLAGFLFFAVTQCLAQTGTIKGIVVNSQTRERLPFAVVYINYTTLGTSANERGEFILRNVPIGQQDLVATFVGHNPQKHKIIVKDSAEVSLTIGLESKNLKELTIRSKKDKNWERQYEKFKRLFLGNSSHAFQCEILNPWVLSFEWNNNGFFTASAADILEIENFSLGYKLYYQMVNFKIGSQDYLIGGNVRFQAMETTDSATMALWFKNRSDVYSGSSRHLFRAIVSRTLTEDGFELYKDDTGADDIIRMGNFLSNLGREISAYSIEDLHYTEVRPNEFKIEFPERLEIHYLNKSDDPTVYHNVVHPVSWLETENDFLLVNSEGVVLKPDQMVLSGNMSEARIAELLPYDFIPPKSTFRQSGAGQKPKRPVNALQYLLERPYLHTDKSYYYPNETVWFRGYINYGARVFRDSLSQVLYVDLVDAQQNIAVAKIFEINQGTVKGDFVIPSKLLAGDYVLRAYTRWMLNFDSMLTFTKPIKLLDYSEMAKSTTAYEQADSASAISIQSAKDIYDKREKIIIRIGLKDFLGNFSPADFSIAVTDFQQVVPASNEKNIVKDFVIPDISLPDSLPRDVNHPIEHGMNFSGRFVTNKGKPSQGLITVARENTAQIFTITTEKDGVFAFSNIKLYDTAKLSVLAKTANGRVGKVILDSMRFTPRTPVVNPLDLEIVKGINPARHNSSNDSLIAHMLDEVTIKETRLEARGGSTFGLADQVVTGEWIRSLNTQDVLMALQSKVSGLRVVNGFIRLGPQTGINVQTPGDGEPLVLLDGVPVNAFSDGASESTASLIRNLSPHDVERVEILKYSNAAAYGSRGANGVISIATRKNTGNYQRFGERGRFVDVHVPGFSPVKKFRSRDYSVDHDSHSLPDYRSTLYWNPSLSTGEDNFAEVSFYAADLATQYRIVVEGITSDGRVAHGEKLITVSEAP